MENSRKTSSVIAKLMGLDETPTRQRSVSRQQRVLSGNYLLKSGSIGKRSRKDSLNSLLASKKRANLRTNKDTLSRDLEQKNMHLDGMKSPIVISSGNTEENGRLFKNKKIVVLRPNFGNVQHGSGPSFLHSSQTVFAWEAKKQLLERRKMTKVSQRFQPDFVNTVGIKSKEVYKSEAVAKLPVFKAMNFSSNLNTKYVKTRRSDMTINTKKNNLVLYSSTPFPVSSDVESETKNVQSFYGDTEDRSNCGSQEECSSHSSDLSSEQDSPVRSHEDGSISSNCISVDEEHSIGKLEACHHSPISVLETPFREEDNSLSSECCGTIKTDLQGLWMQLHLLQSESEENNSNQETVISSDDDRSTCPDQNTTSTIFSGAKESRDFSYLVDVLNESAFQNSNVEIQFQRWHSPECMAGALVFERLEKKYGKQELWHKSERKLLFDRINSGMTEICRPRVDIKVSWKPLRRKMRSMLRRDVIEEELSALLLDQEKGVGDGVSEKAVGRGLWFDPVDELDSIVEEIEVFLFDELTAEFVYA